jgi:hypothetical protein
MKKGILIVGILIVLVACGVRQTRTLLASGDYDEAISQAVSQLRTNKNAKGKQEYVLMLEEAFAKAKERDLRNIDFWKKENNPSNLESIYNAFVQLDQRQETIRPLLPLNLQKQHRKAVFMFDNYADDLVKSKTSLSEHLYKMAELGLKNASKLEARNIYEDLIYLDKINPNYKNTRKLIETAQTKGTDFVHVYTKNETNMIIPVRLQNDLLDFGTQGLNDRWTVYHSNRLSNVKYDFGMILNFRNILISPEQVREKEFSKEKQVKDGVQTLLDSNGNVVKDSLGKPIKVDKFKTVRATIYEFTQFKSCLVEAKVDYIDFNNNQLIATFPLVSEFVFEHIYATCNGDRSAADESYISLFERRAVPFPSNEQMVFDTGEDLKQKLKTIISRNRFRK